MKLFIGLRKTRAHEILERGLTTEGATVTRRKKGWTDFDVIKNLMSAGWLEPRAAGVRGGIKYFTTSAGKAAIEYTKIARSYPLWSEFVDVDGVMSISEFYNLTIEQKVKIQIDMFGKLDDEPFAAGREQIKANW